MINLKLEDTIFEKQVTVTNNGMICIPAAYRKLYKIKDGDKVLVVEDEGTLKIIPIRELEDLRTNSYTSKEIIQQIRESKKEVIKREK